MSLLSPSPSVHTPLTALSSTRAIRLPLSTYFLEMWKYLLLFKRRALLITLSPWLLLHTLREKRGGWVALNTARQLLTRGTLFRLYVVGSHCEQRPQCIPHQTIRYCEHSWHAGSEGRALAPLLPCPTSGRYIVSFTNGSVAELNKVGDFRTSAGWSFQKTCGLPILSCSVF